jgi:DNA-binding response OmpR family regulator
LNKVGIGYLGAVDRVEPKKAETRPYDAKLLLVDDEPDITLALAKGLEENGFSTDAFNDPHIALAKFKPAFYDLLLLDVKMPAMNGFQLYQEIKKKDPEARVCFITAYEVFYDKLKDEYPKLDVGCFIKKPIETKDLVSKIRNELNADKL